MLNYIIETILNNVKQIQKNIEKSKKKYQETEITEIIETR